MPAAHMSSYVGCPIRRERNSRTTVMPKVSSVSGITNQNMNV